MERTHPYSSGCQTSAHRVVTNAFICHVLSGPVQHVKRIGAPRLERDDPLGAGGAAFTDDLDPAHVLFPAQLNLHIVHVSQLDYAV